MGQVQSPWFCGLHKSSQGFLWKGAKSSHLYLYALHKCAQQQCLETEGHRPTTPDHTYRHCSFLTTLTQYTHLTSHLENTHAFIHLWVLRAFAHCRNRQMERSSKLLPKSPLLKSQKGPRGPCPPRPFPLPLPEDRSQSIVMREEGERQAEIHCWDREQAWMRRGQS